MALSEAVEEEPRSPVEEGAPGVAEIRESLAHQPKPNSPQTYKVREAAFWLHRHVPPGSVVRFQATGEDGSSDAGLAAALVTKTTSLGDGIWLGVDFLGAERDETKKNLQQYFRRGRRDIHSCYPNSGGECPVAHESGLHLFEFDWWPPGDFDAPWLNATGRKKVKSGPGLEVEARRNAGLSEPRDVGEPSPTERRLSALRKERRVSFGPPTAEARSSRLDDGRAPEPSDGTSSGGGGLSSARQRRRMEVALVKSEVVDLTRSSSRPRSSEEVKKKSKLGDTLAQAALAHREAATKRDRKERDRSKSKKRKKKEKKKKRRSASSSDSSGDQSSSDSSSLLPPLKRKSQRKPGSVMRMRPGWNAGRRRGGVRAGVSPQALHVLPAGPQTRAGPAKQRCQGIGTLVQGSGHFARRQARASWRSSRRQVDCRRHGHSTRVADGAPLGDPQPRRGGDGPRTYPVAGPEAREAGRKSGWQRFLEQIAKLGRRLVFRASSKRKDKGDERKGQERKIQRKRRQDMAILGQQRQRKRRREEASRSWHMRGEDAIPAPAGLAGRADANTGDGEMSKDEGRGISGLRCAVPNLRRC